MAKLGETFANSPGGVVSAYLHGSHAEEREHSESDVDIVILNDAPAPLARHVAVDGIRVFCQDEEADHAFRRDVQLRAADLSLHNDVPLLAPDGLPARHRHQR